MKTEDILNEREKTHGEYNRVADLTQHLRSIVAELTEETTFKESLVSNQQKVALDMMLLKIARIVCGDPNHADHWDDIAGYAMLGKGRKESIVSGQILKINGGEIGNCSKCERILCETDLRGAGEPLTCLSCYLENMENAKQAQKFNKEYYAMLGRGKEEPTELQKKYCVPLDGDKGRIDFYKREEERRITASSEPIKCGGCKMPLTDRNPNCQMPMHVVFSNSQEEEKPSVKQEKPKCNVHTYSAWCSKKNNCICTGCKPKCDICGEPNGPPPFLEESGPYHKDCERCYHDIKCPCQKHLKEYIEKEDGGKRCEHENTETWYANRVDYRTEECIFMVCKDCGLIRKVIT